jgi:hypothetical protein
VLIFYKIGKNGRKYFVTKNKRSSSVVLFVRSRDEIECKLNELQENEKCINIRALNIDYSNGNAYITFSNRESAEAAVNFFGSEICKYADKKLIPDCALYVSFDMKLINNNKNVGNDDIYDELYWLFSFGEKVSCKIEMAQNDRGDYEGRAIIEYGSNPDGKRVFFFFFLLFYFFFLLLK